MIIGCKVLLLLPSGENVVRPLLVAFQTMENAGGNAESIDAGTDLDKDIVFYSKLTR